MSSRINSHYVETISIDFVRSTINSYYPNGDALIREWSEKDYGVDLVLELFENGNPTAKIAFLQIKGTAGKIKKIVTDNYVSCPNVTSCSLEYAKQRRVPLILIFVQLEEPKRFYFIDIQSFNVDDLLKTLGVSNKKSIRIPYENNSLDNLDKLFEIVNSYYA